jgi:regulator-associated protein of mTOR
VDLVKDNGFDFFINVINSKQTPADQRAMSTFILSVLMNHHRAGQSGCLYANLLPICLVQLFDNDPLVRRWTCFCLAKLWEEYEDAKLCAIRESAHEKLYMLLTDPIPEV